MTTPRIVTIEDERSGARASVLVGLGFNCYRFLVRHGDSDLDVLWSESEFDSGLKRAAGSGIPVLFPFPGRIAGQTLTWQGRQFALAAGDGRGNAIHGFVLSRPWRIVERSAQHVRGQFQASVDDPTLLDCWPADFRITASYSIDHHTLSSELLIENPDQQPLPCGLGLHPYFRTPLGGSDAGACIVRLPVASRWELVEMLPTGKKLPVPQAERYRAGVELSSLVLDDVFSDLPFEDDWCQASIFDPGSGRRVKISFDRAFSNCVVYNPPHREALCIEPYTCVPDAFRLESAGVDAGLRVLQPGESFVARWTIEVE
jgi:aldose 1-epimerase